MTLKDLYLVIPDINMLHIYPVTKTDIIRAFRKASNEFKKDTEPYKYNGSDALYEYVIDQYEYNEGRSPITDLIKALEDRKYSLDLDTVYLGLNVVLIRPGVNETIDVLVSFER